MSDPSEKHPRQRDQAPCPCKSGMSYATCCLPYHHGKATPDTAEQLMRSRYSAYFFRLTDYLVSTTHPDSRTPELKAELEETAHQVNWCYLQVIATSKGGKQDKVGKVEFSAGYFFDDERHELHEVSRFRRHKGLWKYLDGKS